MMNRMTRLITGAVAALLLTVAAGCGGRHVDARLDAAEGMMEVAADSALRVLEEIDGTGLSGDRGARYALLLTQARDKNEITEGDDSLIGIAYRHYMAGDNRRRQMLASHYMGVVSMNGGNYGAALSAALRAERIALETGDAMNAARTESLISEIYGLCQDERNALEYEKRSLANSHKAGRKDWVDEGYQTLADKYLSCKILDSAKIYLDSARQVAGSDAMEQLKTEVLIYVNGREYGRADSVLNIMAGADVAMSAQFTALRALTRHKAGDEASSGRLLAEAVAGMKTTRDSIDVAYVGSMITHETGKHSEAFGYMKQLMAQSNKALRTMMNRSVNRGYSEFESRTSHQLEERLENTRRLVTDQWIIMALTVVIAVIVAYIIKTRYERRARENEERLYGLKSEYEDMKRELAENSRHLAAANDRSTCMNETIRSLSKNVAAMREVGNRAFVQRFEWMEKIGTMAIEAPLGKQRSARYNRLIDEELNSIRLEEYQQELEGIINSSSNNLIERLRSRCGLTEEEVRMAVYMCGGLSARVVGLLLGIRNDVVYNRRSRLRNKIARMDKTLLDEMDEKMAKNEV